MSTAIDVSPSPMSGDPGLMSFVFQTDLAPGLDEADRPAVWNLLTLLKVVAGSARASAFAVSPVTSPASWVALEDAPEAAIAGVVARVETRNAPWRLPGDESLSVLERLDAYFVRIERRARAVRG
jgi:hypothetical protein